MLVNGFAVVLKEGFSYINIKSFYFFRMKLHSRAIRESVVFAKRVTGPEAKEMGIIDSCASIDNLINAAKNLGFGALGKNDIDREILKTMKQDMFPRRVSLEEAKL